MTAESAPRIDHWMPRWDFSEFHETRVAASPEQTWDAIQTIDLAEHRVARAILAMRGLPGRLMGRGRTGPPARITLDDFEAQGFVPLESLPHRELIIGLTGRFWRPTGGIETTDPATFHEPVPAGLARVAWNFLLTPGAGGTHLSTETRILCADPGTRRRFGAYWFLIRGGSGLLRRFMLGMIREQAEATAAAP